MSEDNYTKIEQARRNLVKTLIRIGMGSKSSTFEMKLIYDVYFNEVYFDGKNKYKNAKNYYFLRKELNLIDNFNSILQNMGDKHQIALVIAINKLIELISEKESIVIFDKNTIVDYFTTSIRFAKDYLKQEKEKENNHSSNLVDLTNSLRNLILKNIYIQESEEELQKYEEQKNNAFEKQQQHFLEVSEEYRNQFGERKSNLR